MTLVPTALTKMCQVCGAAYSYDEAHSCIEGNTKLYQDDLPVVQPESLIGAILGGRYRIDDCLEAGGMGVVLRGHHVALDRPVAIKIMVMREPQEEAARKRFLQEAVLASRVRHGNVIDIFDFGVIEGGHLYLVMEFLEGQTLRQSMALQGGPMPALRSCHIAAQIARGLQAVHDQGIIHRDLKPDNVFLLERDGQPDFVKIVDFGIAKARGGPSLTQVGMVLGTPQYMSPEQVGNQPTDHRIDQYSLGCVLYRMLTGVLPFDGDSASDILSRHVTEKAVPPRERRPDLGIPASLEVVVLRAMAKRPEDRFYSMRELERALLKEAEHLRGPQVDNPPTRMFPLPEAGKRLRWGRLLTFMVLGGGVAGVALLVMAGRQITRSLAQRQVEAGESAVSFLTGAPGGPPAAAAPAPGAAPAAVAPAAAAPALLPAAECSSSEADLPLESEARAAPVPRREERPRAPAEVKPAREAPAAGPQRWRPQAVKVRFEIRNQEEAGVTITCWGRPPVPCHGGCTLEIPDGPGECTASAPGSGYRPESFTFAELRGRARGSFPRGATQVVNLKYIKY